MKTTFAVIVKKITDLGYYAPPCVEYIVVDEFTTSQGALPKAAQACLKKTLKAYEQLQPMDKDVDYRVYVSFTTDAVGGYWGPEGCRAEGFDWLN